MPKTLADWLQHIERLHTRAVDLGLDRVQEVKERLAVRVDAPIITVGGTNGKGSTCAMLERILLCAGYRVGLYTSPHLLRYNERVRIGGQEASDELLAESFAAVEAVRGEVPLTYFEFGTLAAWWAFARSSVDAVILEVGLGGRLDAVNAFDTDCAILTSIALDHMDYLGETREAIGFEKAGIFRRGRPAIVADGDPPSTVIQAAVAAGADLQLIGRDFGYLSGPLQWQYWGRGGRRPGLAHPALRGAVQLSNASACLAALDSLANGLPVSMQEIRRGLIEVELPGRFQVLPGVPQVVLDVAHNPQAAETLAANLASMNCNGSTWAVFGMLHDKDIGGVIDRMKGQVDHWLPATLTGSRAASAEHLIGLLQARGIEAYASYQSPADACQAARKAARENDRIIIFGSFLTVADALRALSDHL